MGSGDEVNLYSTVPMTADYETDSATTISSAPASGSTNQWVLLIVDYFIMIGIITGNSVTIATVAKFDFLQTPTNYLVVSLSCADLLLGLGGPQYVSGLYLEAGERLMRTNKYACLANLWYMQMSSSTSVASLLAVAVERYLAIVYPLRHSSLVTTRTVTITIVCIWVVTVTLSLPPFAGWDQWQPTAPCAFLTAFTGTYFLGLFALPVACCVIAFTALYLVIMTIAWRQQRRIRDELGNQPQQSTTFKADIKITKMLVTVVGCFYICWGPYLIISFVLVYYGTTDLLLNLYECGKTVVFLNSAINPLIYGLKNRDFRKGYRKLLLCYKRDEGTSGQSTTNH